MKKQEDGFRIGDMVQTNLKYSKGYFIDNEFMSAPPGMNWLKNLKITKISEDKIENHYLYTCVSKGDREYLLNEMFLEKSTKEIK